MALPGGIDIAKNNLATASNSYAEIQKQLDRYNKIFDTYSKASPETQMRAASVMRQALNEYNGLKKQQEENALKIYEAQSRVDYYNKSTPQLSQDIPIQKGQTVGTSNTGQEIPVINTSTPGTLNNNTATQLVEQNAIDTDMTTNIPDVTINPYLTELNNQNIIKPTTPIGVTNYINANTPKYPNTTINNPDTAQYNYSGNNYGAGSSVGLTAPTNVNLLYKTPTINKGRTIISKYAPYVKNVLSGIYKYLTK